MLCPNYLFPLIYAWNSLIAKCSLHFDMFPLYSASILFINPSLSNQLLSHLCSMDFHCWNTLITFLIIWLHGQWTTFRSNPSTLKTQKFLLPIDLHTVKLIEYPIVTYFREIPLGLEGANSNQKWFEVISEFTCMQPKSSPSDKIYFI